MSMVREHHESAMRLAQDAQIAQAEGDAERALELARDASELEAIAASMVSKDRESEPTRSILYRSAATLAYQAGDLDQALRLVAEGLAGYPPPSVQAELKALYEDITLNEHLEAHGIELTPGEVQVALEGDEVGSGFISLEQLKGRLDAVWPLIRRTAERLLELPFHQSGRSTQPYIPMVSSPRMGSFAFTIRLAQRTDKPFSLFLFPDQVITELLEGIRLVEAEDIDGLRERIRDDSYFRHFVAQAKTIAPDGKRIKLVGLTSPSAKVGLTRTQDELAKYMSVVMTAPAPPVPVVTGSTLVGVLNQASLPDDKVGLVTPDKQQHTLVVREGMGDMVRAYFDREVEVTINRVGQDLHLVDIKALDQAA
jgi:hypothetical protein